MTYVETDCTVAHEGRTFEAGGAVVTPERVTAYVGEVEGGRGHNGRLGNEPQYRALTNWHGEIIGTIRLTSSWATPRSFIASRMWQAYATVDGVTYTGRTCGEGMVFNGRRCKA